MDETSSGWILVLAILGAAAWIPQIIQLFIKYFAKPKLISINQKDIEIGYNTFGPIINFSMAFLAENEKALVQKINLRLKHSNSESHLFQWIWYEESLFQMDILKTTIPYKKNQVAIALNVPKDFMIEKKIGFQSNNFKLKFDEIAKLVEEDFANIKNSDGNLEDLKSNKNYNHLVDHVNNSFMWNTGKYDVEIEIFIAKRKLPFAHKIEFALNNLDIRKLKENIPLCKKKIDDVLFHDEDPKEPLWNWIYCKDLKDSIN